MACRTWAELLAARKRAGRLYAMAQRIMRGLSREEFRRAFEETDCFRRVAEDGNYAPLEHWRQQHSLLAGKIRRFIFPMTPARRPQRAGCKNHGAGTTKESTVPLSEAARLSSSGNRRHAQTPSATTFGALWWP